MDDQDLQQVDLSHLSLTEMTPEQRAEMKRRYLEFVSRHAKPPKTAPRRAAKMTRWVPGQRPN
jgi:hypothetical protein